MDTRKLFTALALILFSATCFAQLTHPEPAASAPGDNYEIALTSAGLWNEIAIYKNEEGANVIKWSIEGKQPLEFLLQASTDGKNYRAIKRIAAESTTRESYQATGNNSKNWTCFRVICIDAAGAFSYSPVVQIK